MKIDDSALIGAAGGLVSGVITAYFAMRFRLREERAKWSRDLALKYATARTESPAVAASLAEQFGSGLLIISEPGKARRRYFIPSYARVIVGKGRDVDIKVTEGTASRQHCALEHREDGFFLVDFGATNGTWLNGARVKGTTKLESGDKVTIGDTDLIFVAL